MAERQLHNQASLPLIGFSRLRLGSDGEGITTLVAFHGCNLKCKYCLNPEALGSDESLPLYTPENLYVKVKIDDVYFRATGGGVTFGGGEPCLQADFIVRFRELCGNDWKLRIETALHAPLDNVKKLVPVIDEWIVDIKTDDLKAYQDYTGADRHLAVSNLHWLTDHSGIDKDKILVRIPEIPGFTTPEMVTSTRNALANHGITRFDLLVYQTEPSTKQRDKNAEGNPGKAKCEILKVIRAEIADTYNIDISERECTETGQCLGTCQFCDAELAKLTESIKKKGNRDLKISDDTMDRYLRLKTSESIERNFGEDLGDIMPPPLDDDDDMPMGKLAYPYIEIYEQPEYEYKRVFFKKCSVAGLSFHLEKDDELWDELCAGTKIALVRDKNNKHDSNAVAVALADDYNGDPDDFDFDFILGYVPRTENAEIAALLDAGYSDKFEAEISSYKRYGKYEDRIQITIWLRSNEQVRVRPNLLRAETLNRYEFSNLIQDLQTRGVAYFRFGGFPPEDHDLPQKGERIVLLHIRFGQVFLYLMKVIAVDGDCRRYFDDPSEIDCVDDCVPFILSNITGPVVVDERRLKFMPFSEVENLSVHNYLNKEISAEFEAMLNLDIRYWTSRNNIDADPSLDDPKE